MLIQDIGSAGNLSRGAAPFRQLLDTVAQALDLLGRAVSDRRLTPFARGEVLEAFAEASPERATTLVRKSLCSRQPALPVGAIRSLLLPHARRQLKRELGEVIVAMGARALANARRGPVLARAKVTPKNSDKNHSRLSRQRGTVPSRWGDFTENPLLRETSPTLAAPETTMATNSIRYILGEVTDLSPLFPFKPGTMKLSDCIGLCLNQTLRRDGFVGAWADVFDKDGQIHVRIASPDPNADVTNYPNFHQAWLSAVKIALSIYLANDNPKPPDIAFLPPFGLAMLNNQSVQLLHYPPLETLGSMDYLYSPTNRRWETLLQYNNNQIQQSLLETITDIVPVAAGGGKSGGKEIEVFQNDFAPYVQAMLGVLLNPVGSTTTPVVAYGGPVMDFISFLYPNANDISPLEGHPTGSPKPLSLYKLPFIEAATTPVLCANHPSLFMYEPKASILLEDLIAARWQVQMSKTPTNDPVLTLAVASAYWNDPGQAASLEQILELQKQEFGD